MTRPMRWLVAGSVVLAVGLVAVVYEAFQAPTRFARLRRRQNDLLELQRLAAARADVVGILSALNQLPETTPIPLDKAAAEVGNVLQPIWTVEGKQSVGGGWTVVRANVTLNQVSFERMWMFLQRLGEVDRRSPWRLVEITLAASDRGRGQAIMVLEALTRSAVVSPGEKEEP